MIDTHAHLHDPKYDDDRDKVIRQIFSNGVERVITIGTSVQESYDAIALAHTHENIFACVGVHPDEFNKIVQDDNALEQLRSMMGDIVQMAQDEKVVGIGEVGLDYHSHTSDMITPEQKLLQATGFKEQIKIALHLKRPLIIHCRDAYDDCYDILKKMKMFGGSMPIIFHCYGGDVLFTKKILKHENVYISFAGNITYPVKKALAGTKDDIQESVQIVPLERILSETDSPYLTPQKKRGLRNSPEYVQYVVEELACIKGIRKKEVVESIRINVRKVFPKLFI